MSCQQQRLRDPWMHWIVRDTQRENSQVKCYNSLGKSAASSWRTGAIFMKARLMSQLWAHGDQCLRHNFSFSRKTTKIDVMTIQRMSFWHLFPMQRSFASTGSLTVWFGVKLLIRLFHTHICETYLAFKSRFISVIKTWFKSVAIKSPSVSTMCCSLDVLSWHGLCQTGETRL